MKKNFVLITLAIFLFETLIVFGAFAYFIVSSDTTPATAYREPEMALEEESFDITAMVETKGRQVLVKERIKTGGSQQSALLYLPPANVVKTNILSLKTDSGVREYELIGDTFLKVECGKEAKEISLELELHLEGPPSTLCTDSGVYYLTNFLAAPAVFREDKAIKTYKFPFGDPYVYNSQSYRVTFKTGLDAEVYAPGNKSVFTSGDEKITVFEAYNLRDFPAVLTKGPLDVKKAVFNETDIWYIGSFDVREYVEEALAFAQENIGPYPYDQLYVVKAPIPHKGMEFSCMIFISERLPEGSSELKRLTYHEVLHQWFYGIIGTDQINEPFFDEGLVNYLSSVLAGGKARFMEPNMGFLKKRLEDYSSYDEYCQYVYNDAAYYFGKLAAELGNNFYDLLKRVYKEKMHSIVYYNEFVSYLDDYRRN